MVISKLLAQTAARTRTLWSILTHTIIIDEDTPVVNKIREESRAFDKNAADLKARLKKAKDDKEKGAESKVFDEAQTAVRSVGAPAPHMMIAMVEAWWRWTWGARTKTN